jgi:SAM-dependent methyltransferase
MLHFYQKIYGWFDYENIFKYVVRLFGDGANFLEVGCYKGKSTAYLATEIINSGKKQNITCVDIFENSKIVALGGEPYSLEEFQGNIKPVEKVIHPVVMESTVAALKYADETFDFIFLDAGHSYEEILADIRAWYPKLKFGGIIGGHDFSPMWIGIEKAVREFFINDFVKIDNSWIHVKPKGGECFKDINVSCLILNDIRRGCLINELNKFNISFHEIPCILADENINVWQANGYSFLKVFESYLNADCPKPLLILEDDIQFTAYPKTIVENAIHELPEDWDLLYLGANIKSQCLSYSKHLNIVTGAWCTHSVLFSKKAINFIIKNFDPMKDFPLDEWLRNNTDKMKMFICKPTLVTQRSGWSFIANQEVNYECIFNSQNLLTE